MRTQAAGDAALRARAYPAETGGVNAERSESNPLPANASRREFLTNEGYTLPACSLLASAALAAMTPCVPSYAVAASGRSRTLGVRQ